jgi:hypothetical protein
VRSLRLINQTIAAFSALEGFEPYTFAADADPPSVLRGAKNWEGISRSFRYEADGISSHVRVHGDRRTTSHRSAVSALVKAGYEAFRLQDETWCRRSLAGARQVVAELAFLRGLGVDATPSRWPHRATTMRPVRPRQPTQQELAKTIEVVRSAGINWNDFCVGYSRRGSLNIQGVDVPLTVLVCGIALTANTSGVLLYVNVFDPSKTKRPLPLALVRRLNGALKAAGYERTMFRTRAGLVRDHVTGTKTILGARAAARACARIHSLLTEGGVSL